METASFDTDSAPIWQTKLDRIQPIGDLAALPNYGWLFFLKNLGPFRAVFLLLTGCNIISTLLRFWMVYLLGSIVSHVETLSLHELFLFYMPAWLAASAAAEGLEYFTRKYAEAMPAVYRDYTVLRFYLTFLGLDARRLFNVSKERLTSLVSRYVSAVYSFLSDWVWGTVSKVIQLFIVLTILAVQSPTVLGLNLLYMLCFLALSLRISAAFSPVAKRYTEQELESATIVNSFLWNLNTVKRLALQAFFTDICRALTSKNWARLHDVRKFHARRWLLQLNLFNLLYIGTIGYAIYQIKIGVLSLGYLVLLKWAFDQLWQILVYIIEQYVSLIQQKQDAEIVRRELSELTARRAEIPEYELNGWREIVLEKGRVEFAPQAAGDRSVSISVPRLEIRPGEKIGIIGESGSGKTTILNMLLNLVSFEGSYRIDGREMAGCPFNADHITIVTSSDPLFKLSLYDNILLGRSVPAERLEEILRGVEALDFAADLDARVGSSDFNLSTGQEQRIRLARGLLQESSFYLLDEPFSGIDLARKRQILQFLKKHLDGKAVILVTHNRDELALVDRVYELKDGVLHEA